MGMGEINANQNVGGLQELARDVIARPKKDQTEPKQRVSAPDPIEQTQKLTEKADAAIELTADAVSPDRLAELVEELREAMPSHEKSLEFKIDEVLDRAVVSVIDKNTGEMIRQLPSEEVVRAAHNIHYMRGVLFDDRS